MNPRDFKIGNLLHDREGRLCRVEELDKEKVTAPAIKGPLTSHPIKEILLTEDWFIRFGFTKVGGHFKNDEDFRFAFLGGVVHISIGDDKLGILIKHIKFVHELQNFYEENTGTRLNP